jgi:hypothetical protein
MEKKNKKGSKIASSSAKFQEVTEITFATLLNRNNNVKKRNEKGHLDLVS